MTMEFVFTLVGICLLTQFSENHVTATDCQSYEAERKQGKALVGHTIKTVQLEHFECLNACNEAFHCFSTNLYRHNGSTTCELNKSTRQLSPRSLVHRSGYEYNEITKMDVCGVGQCKLKNGKSSGPIAHWRLNGEDPDVTLHGDATYVADNVGTVWRRVLYLDGTRSFAVTPAVDFRSTSFTIALWLKIESSAASADIYSDWSGPHQFRVGYTAANKGVRLQARNINGRDHLMPAASNVLLDQWVHVAIRWNRETLKATILLNGKQVASANARHPDALNLMANNHAVYDIGLKRDSGSATTFKGFLRELMIFDRALQDSEVQAIKDMPVHMIPWKLKIFNDGN